MNEILYPLKFETQFKEKIWGGTKIRDVLGKDFGNAPNCGETWEISGVSGNISVVKDGPLKGKKLTDLIESYQGQLVGEAVYNKYGNEFPLLIKFIDANDDLSVQVHPDDKVAKERHNAFGKTEMWYVLQADPGATLIAGFNRQITRADYTKYLSSGQIMNVLNKEEVSAGDVFFIPAGRVHTIGKGLLIAEIQQTSDLTYRIYDFDRVDDEGNKRELHNDLALDVIDFKKYPAYKSSYKNELNQPLSLAACEYFETQKYNLTKGYSFDAGSLHSFEILIGLEGEMSIDYNGRPTTLVKGEVVLLPATSNNVKVTAISKGASVLKTFIPN